VGRGGAAGRPGTTRLAAVSRPLSSSLRSSSQIFACQAVLLVARRSFSAVQRRAPAGGP
jgi:hypothetical protein